MKSSERKEKLRLIEQDIERTRADMDHTIDALRGRFTFDSILRIGLDRMGGPNVFLRNLGATVRDNPVPFLLSGVGIAWLALSRPHEDGEPHYYERSRSSSSGSGGPGLFSRAKERFGQAKERLGETVEHAKDRVGHARERAGELAGRARDRRHELGERGSALSDRARDGARRAGRFVSSTHRDNPFLVPLAGLAAGAALGALFPSTRIEDETLGGARDAFVDPLKGSAREAASRAGERVKSEVSGGARSSEATGGAASGTSQGDPIATSSARSPEREAVSGEYVSPYAPVEPERAGGGYGTSQPPRNAPQAPPGAVPPRADEGDEKKWR